MYGDGVNIAARLESLAEPGGITISGTVFDHAENKLPVSFEFVGEQSVKNIAKPVRVCRVGLDSAQEISHRSPQRPTRKATGRPTRWPVIGAGAVAAVLVIAA